MKRGEHDCPQCGQDMRLPPDAYKTVLKLKQYLKEVLERLVDRHA